MQRTSRMTFGLLFAAIVLAAFPQAVLGAYYYNWNNAQMFTDPVDDSPYSPTPGQNLLATWHAFDGTYHYFRIDLASAPAYENPPGYADTYGLFIDSKTGGAPNSNRYVPGTLAGIDYIVDTELEFDGLRHNRLDWDPELMRWMGTKFNDSENLRFQAIENGGKTLEWRVKEGGNFVIGSSFKWWAASLLPGDDKCGSGKVTYDVLATPIPNAAWLLGAGVVALVGLKRRRQQKP